MYFELSNPSIGKKTNGRKISPTANPPLLPNLGANDGPENDLGYSRASLRGSTASVVKPASGVQSLLSERASRCTLSTTEP